RRRGARRQRSARKLSVPPAARAAAPDASSAEVPASSSAREASDQSGSGRRGRGGFYERSVRERAGSGSGGTGPEAGGAREAGMVRRPGTGRASWESPRGTGAPGAADRAAGAVAGSPRERVGREDRVVED